MTTHYQVFNSPLGMLRVTANQQAITGLWFFGQKYEFTPQSDWIESDNNSLLNNAVSQLKDYFSAKRTTFDLPIEPQGTEFQQRVWSELTRINWGQTITYGDLAKRIGKPKAVRAAAAAVGKNPVSVIVPCHRVLGSNGSLTGYAGGLMRKEKLLELEG